MIFKPWFLSLVFNNACTSKTGRDYQQVHDTHKECVRVKRAKLRWNDSITICKKKMFLYYVISVELPQHTKRKREIYFKKKRCMCYRGSVATDDYCDRQTDKSFWLICFLKIYYKTEVKSTRLTNTKGFNTYEGWTKLSCARRK